MSRTVPARGALVAWACLTVAIVAEVVGTSFMAHAARDGGWTGYLIMAGALALSYSSWRSRCAALLWAWPTRCGKAWA